MGKSQRTKGAVFEREIAQRFTEALGTSVKRNIGQARDGGNDLDVGPLVVECKRRKTLTTLRGWYEQALRAIATRSGYMPVVVMREDGQTEPYVLLELRHFLDLVTVEMQRRMGVAVVPV